MILMRESVVSFLRNDTAKASSQNRSDHHWTSTSHAGSTVNAFPCCSTALQTTSRSAVVNARVKGRISALVILAEASYCGPVRCFYGPRRTHWHLWCPHPALYTLSRIFVPHQIPRILDFLTFPPPHVTHPAFYMCPHISSQTRISSAVLAERSSM